MQQVDDNNLDDILIDPNVFFVIDLFDYIQCIIQFGKIRRELFIT